MSYLALSEAKYVRYRDVRHEIVDHWDSDIENIWLEDPKVSFQKALKQTYSKFPITGVTHLSILFESDLECSYSFFLRILIV